MSVRDIPHHKLVEVAKYLDGFPPSRGNHDDEMGEEQYWVLFIKELKRVPKLGKKFSYTNVQIVDFGDERKGHSPSLKLLYDLREKKLELDTFVYCLQKINCTGAMNVFRDATTPVITLQPESQTLKRGETIILIVDAKCDPGPPQFQWFKGEMPLTGEKSNKLVIYGAHGGNSGFYCCRVKNPFINDEQKANVFSQWTRLEVEEQGVLQAQSPIRQEIGTPLREEALPQYPLITLQPSPLTVDYRSKAVLECRAEGAVVFDWLKNGKPYRQGAKDGRLVFETAMMEDGGEYQCVVVNDRGRVESIPVRLTVESVIEILEQPADVSGRVGSEVTLRCRARGTKDGDKKLVYQWFEKGGDSSVRDREIGSEEQLRAKLDFKSHRILRVYCVISLPEDREVSVRSRTARITVNTVWFTRQPEDREGYFGQHYCLICEAEGLGNITYLWLKSSTKDGRKDPVKKSKTVSIDGGILTFQALGQNDWGYYTCQAENDQNHIDSRTVQVSVGPQTRNGREVKRPVVRVTKQPRSQVVAQGGGFRLTCTAVSTEDEPLQYQWFHSGKKLPGSTQETLVRSNIAAEHYGSYYCEVKTNSGMGCGVSQSARIEPASVHLKWNLEKKSGEQLRQLEAERLMATARKERYALEKVALLIGNQKYNPSINPLLSPENDIRKLHKLLEAPPLNFKVISLVNLKFREMMKALETFYEMLAVPGVYALFYFSGHGFSFQGSTYLVPVDATLPLMCENNIEANAIGVSMQQKMSRAIVVLDCCKLSKDDIATPQTSLTSLTSFANHIEISSCMDNTVALESRAEPYSTFNIAFRSALAEKTIIHNVFTSVNDALRKAELSLNGDPYQRPNYKGSFADNEITLHDAVMMDDPKTEEQLDKIHHYWQLAQTLPDSLLLPGSEDLAGVMEVELSFSPEFSNVLLVAIKVWLLQANSTCTAIELDKPFLAGQDVHGELFSGANPPMLRITNIQRLQQNLKLILKFSVTVGGEMKEGTVTHELQHKPLFACLLEHNS